MAGPQYLQGRPPALSLLSLLCRFLQLLCRLIQSFSLLETVLFFLLDGSVIQLLFLSLLDFHLLLVFQDLLCCKLEDVGLRKAVLADGSQEILVRIEQA